MDELLYSPLDIAVILSGLDLDCRQETAFLNRLWEQERAFFQSEYRAEKKKWLLAVYYWSHYWYDKPSMDAEFPCIQRDALSAGGDFREEGFTSDFSNLDLFFKNARLRILYGPGRDYLRVKRRTLMSVYGYRRLSPALKDRFHRCCDFYHLQTYVRGGIACSIEDAGIDEMLIFRVL